MARPVEPTLVQRTRGTSEIPVEPEYNGLRVHGDEVVRDHEEEPEPPRPQLTLPPPTPEQRLADLKMRIVNVLSRDIKTTKQVSRDVGEDMSVTRQVLGELKKERRIVNVALTDQQEKWTWRPGPTASKEDIHAQIKTLLMYMPMTQGELAFYIGVDPERKIDGEISEIRRVKARDAQGNSLIYDMACGFTHPKVWFWAAAALKPDGLEPKKTPEQPPTEVKRRRGRKPKLSS